MDTAGWEWPVLSGPTSLKFYPKASHFGTICHNRLLGYPSTLAMEPGLKILLPKAGGQGRASMQLLRCVCPEIRVIPVSALRAESNATFIRLIESPSRDLFLKRP
uniref:Uncharacterized protein n=1 Tax=Bursaphelenchus xylophilus TaxID=6326 RepID=A0A1I7STS5_BURXY